MATGAFTAGNSAETYLAEVGQGLQEGRRGVLPGITRQNKRHFWPDQLHSPRSPRQLINQRSELHPPVQVPREDGAKGF